MLAVAALVLGGCEASPDEQLAEARARLERGAKLGEAGQQLREVLEARPQDWEAHSLLAELHRKRGDWMRAEGQLLKLADLQERGLSATSSRAEESNLSARFLQVYREWADALEEGGGEAYPEVLRKGYALEAEGTTFRKKLVAFHRRRAAGAQEPDEALSHWKRVLELAEEGSAAGKIAESEAKKIARRRFVERARERLSESAKGWAEEIDGLTRLEPADGEAGWSLELLVSVDRRLAPESEEDRREAVRYAEARVVARLRELALAVAGLNPATDLKFLGRRRGRDLFLTDFSEADTTLGGDGTVEVGWRIPDTAVLRIAFELRWEVARRFEGGPASPGARCPNGSWRHRFVLREKPDGSERYETLEACRSERRGFLEDEAGEVLRSVCRCEIPIP